MAEFNLFKNGVLAPIVLEDNGVHGVKKMAGIFAKDIERVTGKAPEITAAIPNATSFVIYLGLAESAKVQNEFKDVIDTKDISGKRETYGIFMFENPDIKGQQVLAIVGSDKRGLTYGMFHISEIIGVSPWYF